MPTPAQSQACLATNQPPASARIVKLIQKDAARKAAVLRKAERAEDNRLKKAQYPAPADRTINNMLLFQGGKGPVHILSNFHMADFPLSKADLAMAIHADESPLWEFPNSILDGIPDNVVVHSGEHLFHALKAVFFLKNVAAARNILKASTAKTAKELGNEARHIDPDWIWDDAHWLELAPGLMYITLYFKFRDTPGLSAQLLATGDMELVEASPFDRVWGIGLAALDPLAEDRTKWRGQNLLGVNLMNIRTQLRAEADVL